MAFECFSNDDLMVRDVFEMDLVWLLHTNSVFVIHDDDDYCDCGGDDDHLTACVALVLVDAHLDGVVVLVAAVAALTVAVVLGDGVAVVRGEGSIVLVVNDDDDHGDYVWVLQIGHLLHLHQEAFAIEQQVIDLTKMHRHMIDDWAVLVVNNCWPGTGYRSSYSVDADVEIDAPNMTIAFHLCS